MFWPFKRASRPPEKWYAPKIRFVGEQDGPVEWRIKAEWNATLVQHSNIERAYLARVAYEDPQEFNVVLAIRSMSGGNDQLEEMLGRCFVRNFRTDAHLDIMFLSPTQEAELSLVCRPFYQSGQSPVTVTLAAP